MTISSPLGGKLKKKIAVLGRAGPQDEETGGIRSNPVVGADPKSHKDKKTI